jgi:hypothetical protein
MDDGSSSEKEEVWRRARIVAGADPDRLRKDETGYWIKRDEYETDHKMSWEPVRKSSHGDYPEADYPVARIHLRQIDMELEIAVEEKRRQMKEGK